MKQIFALKRLLVALTLLGSMMFVLGGANPTTVLAAGCLANPTTDAQASNQEACVKRYITKCKKDFPGLKEVCNNLTAAQINKCASNDTDLKKSCLEDIKKNGVPNTGNPGENHTRASSYNKDDCTANNFDALDESNCGILKYIILITNVLSGIAATVIVAMMIVGGIQYSAAGADPSKIQAAKQKIINALLALVLLVFGFSILQWLVPGGIF